MRFEWGCQALKNSCHRNQEQHVKNSMVRQLGRSRSDVFARILAHSPSRWRGAAAAGTSAPAGADPQRRSQATSYPAELEARAG